MLDGVIHGGWGYVVAAYSISWAAWLLYLWSLWSRSRRNGPGEAP